MQAIMMGLNRKKRISKKLNRLIASTKNNVGEIITYKFSTFNLLNRNESI